MNNKLETENKIKEILESIKPMLHGDGGDLEFIKYEDNIVYIKFLGACVGCPAASITLNNVIGTAIKDEIPEVLEIINIEDLKNENCSI